MMKKIILSALLGCLILSSPLLAMEAKEPHPDKSEKKLYSSLSFPTDYTHIHLDEWDVPKELLNERSKEQKIFEVLKCRRHAPEKPYPLEALFGSLNLPQVKTLELGQYLFIEKYDLNQLIPPGMKNLQILDMNKAFNMTTEWTMETSEDSLSLTGFWGKAYLGFFKEHPSLQKIGNITLKYKDSDMIASYQRGINSHLFLALDPLIKGAVDIERIDLGAIE